MPTKRVGKWESAWMNNITFIHYFNQLKNLAINAFTWENLPDSIDARFLEMTLFERGYVLFYKDEVLDKFLALPCNLDGEWNVYNIPIFRRAFATNDYNYLCTELDSVIIWRDYLHIPAVDSARFYAIKIAEIERTIDVNIKTQKFPILITSSEKQRLVMKNLYMQYDGNEPIIFGDESLNVNGINAINTGAPFVTPDLLNVKNAYINEYLTTLGIENAYNQKKERMVSDEVGSNYGAVEAHRNVGLKARQDAADAINEMFGLNVQVHFSSNLATLVNGAFNPSLADQHREIAAPEIRASGNIRQENEAANE